VVERQIPVLQLLEVAQHLVFGMVRVEYRMRQDGVLAQQGGRQGRVGLPQLLVERREVGGDAGDQFDQSGDVGAVVFSLTAMPSTPGETWRRL
jgi:hypothetical protein